MAARTNVPPIKGAKTNAPRGSSAQIQQGVFPTVNGTRGRGALEQGNLDALTTPGGGSSTVNSQPVSGKGKK